MTLTILCAARTEGCTFSRKGHTYLADAEGNPQHCTVGSESRFVRQSVRPGKIHRAKSSCLFLTQTSPDEAARRDAVPTDKQR
jgi:hypothetical protein